MISAFALTAERADEAAQDLLVDAFPSTAVNLLPDWEEALGLSGAGLSTAQRQANVVAKLIAVGGQSKADMVAFAATLGFTITIGIFAPFRAGFNGCGDPVGGPEWGFAWGVTVTANTSTLSNAQLLARLTAIAPAETTVFLQD